MNRLNKLLASGVVALALSTPAHATPVDIAFVIDQSFSMGGEFLFIDDAVTAIDAALATEAAVTSRRYGVVGYMEAARTRDNGTALIYSDLSSDVDDVQNQVDPRPQLYGTQEAGYEAAYWAQTGFSWDPAAAKIMILITDEAGDQRSDLGPDAPAWCGGGLGTLCPDRENWLGQELDDNGFLLNVITRENLFAHWNDAVFDINDPTYQGLFSLNDLRDDAAAFTAAFVDAKVAEIVDNLPDDPCLNNPPGQGGCPPDIDPPPAGVPEPGTLGLLGLGLLGIGFARRKRA